VTHRKKILDAAKQLAADCHPSQMHAGDVAILVGLNGSAIRTWFGGMEQLRAAVYKSGTPCAAVDHDWPVLSKAYRRVMALDAGVRLATTTCHPSRITRDELAAAAGVAAGTVNNLFGTIQAARTAIAREVAKRGLTCVAPGDVRPVPRRAVA
jgi:hypothetical protein